MYLCVVCVSMYGVCVCVYVSLCVYLCVCSVYACNYVFVYVCEKIEGNRDILDLG